MGCWPVNTFKFREGLNHSKVEYIAVFYQSFHFFYSAAVIISLNSVLFANLHLMEHIDLFVSAFIKK